MSEQKDLDQHADVVDSESAQGHEDAETPHESDDEPMVYETPKDYAIFARRERERRIAEGADPNSVIFQSEIRNHVPRQEGEPPAEFVKRYSQTMNSMIQRGVVILNDQCTADVVASGFDTADGRYFDLGPGSGATKGDFRKFSEWFDESEGGELNEVPERWLKFEKPAQG
ncbi:hypothetical protein N7478_008555 [Penicillium angulare]|uniref:uncharacterized protein n=1 Tax=Penicillium angulare TaxID=116970 RepID=UPI002542040F|nr:uncharacterized protein N7478_008555 [Penicillium angulare]KAJ5273430.1 hypothetical protein N7478_008555 [Penicillium angulare]